MVNLTVWGGLFFFLIGTFVLTALSASLRRLQKRQAKKDFKHIGKLFFYRYFHNYFFPESEFEGIFFANLTALNICRLLFAAFLTTVFFFNHISLISIPYVIFFLAIVLFCFILTDFIPRIFGMRYPHESLLFFSPIASIYLLLAFPFTFLVIKFSQFFWNSRSYDYIHEPMAEGKQEIYDIIQKSDLEEKLEPADKQMFSSFVSFQDLIAREVMVPRVDLFCLPHTTTIKEAAKQIYEEGYSRVPIYKGSIDNIIGVLMYKDLIAKYLQFETSKDPKIVESTVESLVKPVFYTPETKKISHLLQEFRRKQSHLAIVVDEYGGTEGIVTIEDILEQIVGEIEDEYDDEEASYIKLSDGNYIVDGRMSILDIEQAFNIAIPEESDYDTLGGYIFYKAGEIPTKGFSIKHDDFELEVMRANERTIEKVKIKVTPQPLHPS